MTAAPVPDELRDEFLARFDALAGGDSILVAVRSSAIGEDGSSSYAGQYHTELQVPRGALLDAWRAVIASAYGAGAVAYRCERGLTSKPIRMAVACLKMLQPECSGIMFSRAFDGPEADRIVISATRGLGAALAAGEQSADELLIDEGVVSAPASFCVAASQLRSLAGLARALEREFGAPQDIEWAIERDTIYVLQSRPMVIARSSPTRQIVSPEGQLVLLSGGLTACAGAAAGSVVRVESKLDLDEFPDGGVLLARHSSPSFSRVMRRCAAIVTEVGSPTGHMSILAREYGVPTIVGLRGAMNALQAGRAVTVDAAACRVFDGRLAVPEAPRPHRVVSADATGSDALRRVATFVSPLRLIDPSGPEFAAASCQSLHDVTRFVHEKAFEAMFHFGDRASRNRRHAIELQAHLPIVVALHDLGGGLSESARKTAKASIADILSVPAKAFLEGLLDPRIRWDQPRPVSMRGFLSVLGEGIAGLPPEAQEVGRTSYAVVSDRYMNFSTKAGYHFSTVDAWCGESINKNYIHFRFERGGAAGERRERRIRFLSTVLSNLDFKSQPRGDALVARLDKCDQELIHTRLIELGRLTLVARQLDMLMDSDASPEFFARAFLAQEFAKF